MLDEVTVTPFVHPVGAFAAINRLVPAVVPVTNPEFPLIVPINNADGVMTHTGEPDGVVVGVIEFDAVRDGV